MSEIDLLRNETHEDLKELVLSMKNESDPIAFKDKKDPKII